MKTIKHTLLIAALLFTSTAFSQSNKEDVDLIQAIWGKNKKEIIKEHMTLSEAQAGPFWTLYDEYEVERKALGREKIRLIEEYAKNYTTLTDMKADELTKAIIDNNIKTEQLYKKYYDKFSKAIGGINAARFMQIEAYLQTTVRNMVQEEIPLVGEMDKKKKK